MMKGVAWVDSGGQMDWVPIETSWPEVIDPAYYTKLVLAQLS